MILGLNSIPNRLRTYTIKRNTEHGCLRQHIYLCLAQNLNNGNKCKKFALASFVCTKILLCTLSTRHVFKSLKLNQQRSFGFVVMYIRLGVHHHLISKFSFPKRRAKQLICDLFKVFCACDKHQYLSHNRTVPFYVRIKLCHLNELVWQQLTFVMFGCNQTSFV